MEKPICVLGLDISSSKIGIAVLDQNKNIITSEVLKLSSDLSLEERGLMLENKLIKLNKHYYINDVFIEEPFIAFGGGKTTAQTMECVTQTVVLMWLTPWPLSKLALRLSTKKSM